MTTLINLINHKNLNQDVSTQHLKACTRPKQPQSSPLVRARLIEAWKLMDGGAG